MNNNLITIIDCQLCGISGDMLLSSLIDLGASKKKILSSLKHIEKFLDGSKIKKMEFIKTKSFGMNCTKMIIDYIDSTNERNGVEMLRSLAMYCDFLELKAPYNLFVLNSFKTLLRTESKIHGEKIKDVHLHETSSIDTFVDLVGTSVALQDLNILDTKIVTTKIAVGDDMVKTSHGLIPNPSNAILEIFRDSNFILTGRKNMGELTTPTGAAMLVNLTSECIQNYPEFIPKKIGYGSGQKEFLDSANILRLVIGMETNSINTIQEKIISIKSNIDDVSGEILGNLFEVLLKSGAKDVTITSGISKKNRPTNIIEVLCDKRLKDKILNVLFMETGTIGVRVQEIERIVLSRNKLTIPISIGSKRYMINIKIAKDKDERIVTWKPEFDEIKRISSELNLPFKKINEEITYQITKKIGDLSKHE